MKKSNVDVEALKHWKRLSTESKLNWLQSAIEFASEVRRSNPRMPRLPSS